MKYDFETLIPRKNMGSRKWDTMVQHNPNAAEDVIPMSTADMEFKNPPELAEGLKEYIDHSILGYTMPNDAFYASVVRWMKDRHQWDIKPEWLVQAPGVVNALFGIVKTFTEPGDGIIIMQPVYHPFAMAITQNNRVLVNNALIHDGNTYQIDFEDLEKKAKDPKNKMLIFCSPHNPIGRVWTREELEKVGRICIDNNVLVVSDEIHFDFILTGYKHTVFASISEEFAQHCIICTAPSKTFNIAGLKISNIVIPNDELRKKLLEKYQRDFSSNALGIQACRICYDRCGAWKDEMLCMIEYNYQQVKRFVEEKIPQIKVTELQGTYLLWLDCTGLGLSDEQLEKLTLDADLYLNQGRMFGEGGSGFERVNLACPTRYLIAAMERLKKAVDALK
ncbi:MAG TPA: pyridoxal phosphate-dependent aminotransferase [Ruminococcaceae bacterium]|nr:pyridoxal phosphate-dependent aminotransferase [Oscillospiraceae bacterium]HCB64678.1 pyridoxal phosphate-dependent aminotransferase [Oscillospiraceae bacterium]HCU32509.1 pyridoxal phosphate-dependent aminotransferase [Oscillospiraceae bacterium]